MNDRSGASAIQHFGSAIDPRLICPMVVIEKIDFIPFHAKNNVPTMETPGLSGEGSKISSAFVLYDDV